MNDIEAKKTLILLILVFWIVGVFKSLGYHLDTEWLSTLIP